MVTTEPISARLLTGARILGDLWRKNLRCASTWSSNCECFTTDPTQFCRAKNLWFTLALQAGRGAMTEIGPHQLVELMTVPEATAAAVTATITMPGGKTIKVGPMGQMGWLDFAMLSEDMGAAQSVLLVLEKFEGAIVSAPTEIPE